MMTRRSLLWSLLTGPVVAAVATPTMASPEPAVLPAMYMPPVMLSAGESILTREQCAELAKRIQPHLMRAIVTNKAGANTDLRRALGLPRFD